jgi:hypothetical protein
VDNITIGGVWEFGAAALAMDWYVMYAVNSEQKKFSFKWDLWKWAVRLVSQISWSLNWAAG